jgi:tetratricopeptide (TPR) repeat protein
MSENWSTSTEEPDIPPEDLRYAPVDVVPSDVDLEPDDAFMMEEMPLLDVDTTADDPQRPVSLTGYRLSFGEWVRFRILGEDIPAQKENQLRELVNAIERHPDAAVNYVLRGELYLKARQWDEAREDFRMALSLARSQYESSAWGVLAQGVQDRAIQGLRLLGEEPDV